MSNISCFLECSREAARVKAAKENELDRKIATSTVSHGLETIAVELIDLIVGYTENATERTGLLQKAQLISENTHLAGLHQRIKEVAGNFGALFEAEQQQLQVAGKYIITCDIDANQNIDLAQLTKTMSCLPRLQTFNLQVPTNEFSTSNIQSLPPFPVTIKTINLNGCAKLTDNGLQPLASCPNIKTLIVADTAITALPPLSQTAQESLQELDLSRCTKLSAQAFNALAQYTTLKSAGLAFTKIDSLAHLSKSLESINIYQCNELSETELATLALFHALKKITLDRHSALDALPKTIEEIDISHVPNLPACALESLSHFPALKKVSLGSTDSTAFPILPETLEEIDISGNSIPNSKIAEFQRLHPKTKIITNNF